MSYLTEIKDRLANRVMLSTDYRNNTEVGLNITNQKDNQILVRQSEGEDIGIVDNDGLKKAFVEVEINTSDDGIALQSFVKTSLDNFTSDLIRLVFISGDFTTELSEDGQRTISTVNFNIYYK